MSRPNDKQLIDGAFWFSAACVLLLVLTSCSPYAAQPSANLQEVTPSPSTTVTNKDANLHLKTPTPTPDTCTVSTGYDNGRVNLRVGPGTRYAVIKTLAEGRVLTVIHAGAWHEVTDSQHRRGYIYSKYCK